MTTLPKLPSSGSGYRRAVLGLARRHPAEALPQTSLQVSGVTAGLDALAAYDRVCGFRLSDTLPATYPHVLAFPLAMHLMSAADFPFGVIGLIHIANTITQLRPIAANEPLDFTVRAANLRPHDRGRQFDVIATASAGLEEVWRGTSSYLRKEKSSPSPSTPNRSDPVPTPTAIWRIGRDVGPAYAAVSGDRNPIHTSRLGAKALGFPGPIAHGMWSVARCLSAMEGELPAAYTVDVAFKRPIPLPTTVAFTHRGQDFALTGAKSGATHLAGTLTPQQP
jgi:hypothetical protein